LGGSGLVKGGSLEKNEGMGKKTKTPKVIDREGKQGNVFSVDGSNDIMVGED
jgi:hypothetical protein